MFRIWVLLLSLLLVSCAEPDPETSIGKQPTVTSAKPRQNAAKPESLDPNHRVIRSANQLLRSVGMKQVGADHSYQGATVGGVYAGTNYILNVLYPQRSSVYDLKLIKKGIVSEYISHDAKLVLGYRCGRWLFLINAVGDSNKSTLRELVRLIYQAEHNCAGNPWKLVI